MSCCGNKRASLTQSLASNTITEQRPAKMWDDVLFEYIGETALTVKGSVSRNIYRFDKTGDTQMIDYRDVSGMMAVPMLRKCKQ
jgi:CTP:phosphocholine cytidylyltransferase-like protein